MPTPNTTQIPNTILDRLIHQMTDTELRIMLIITRKTMGWFMDPVTGMRKRDDSLSHIQLTQLTGRSDRSISYAITHCNNMGWLEIRNKQGKILRTSKERIGQILFYRLGPAILSNLESYPHVDNFNQPPQYLRGCNDHSVKPPQNVHGLKPDTYIDARDVNDVRNDSDSDIANVRRAHDNNSDGDFKNSEHENERSIKLSKNDIHRCYYLCDKMHEQKRIKLYIHIAKQIGVDLLERAIGLAREDSKIKNKGAYMVKICKTYGYKPNAHTTQV